MGCLKANRERKLKTFKSMAWAIKAALVVGLNSNSSTSKPSTLYEVGTIHPQLISLGTTSGKQTTNHMVYLIANLKITTQPFPLVRKNWSFCLFQEISFTCIGWIKFMMYCATVSKFWVVVVLWMSQTDIVMCALSCTAMSTIQLFTMTLNP